MFLEVLGVITRSGLVAGQQVVGPVRDGSLSGGAVPVSGELVSEQPGSQAGFLSLAEILEILCFVWLGSLIP